MMKKILFHENTFLEIFVIALYSFTRNDLPYKLFVIDNLNKQYIYDNHHYN